MMDAIRQCYFVSVYVGVKFLNITKKKTVNNNHLPTPDAKMSFVDFTDK